MLSNIEVKKDVVSLPFDGKQYFSEKRFGLVGDNFNKEKILKKLQGRLRYWTQ